MTNNKWDDIEVIYSEKFGMQIKNIRELSGDYEYYINAYVKQDDDINFVEASALWVPIKLNDELYRDFYLNGVREQSSCIITMNLTQGITDVHFYSYSNVKAKITQLFIKRRKIV